MKKANHTITLSRDKAWQQPTWNIAGWNPEKIRDAKVMVVGAGALGNEAIKNLTLLDVGHIVVVDFDKVEHGNLFKSILFRKSDRGSSKATAITRHIKDINDRVKTLAIHGDISTDVGLGVIRRMDVVIGCLDNRLARMFINRYCHRLDKTWIDGGIENMAGRYSVYTPGTSCYECTLTDDAREIIRYRLGCADIAKRNAGVGSISTTPIASSIIAAFQVQEALKIIFGTPEHSIAGEAFRYNGLYNFFLKYKESVLKPECDSHEHYDNIVEVPDLSHKNTVKEVLDWLSNYLKTEDIEILLDEEIVLEVATEKEQLKGLAIYKNHLNDLEEVQNMKRDPGEELYITKSVSELSPDFPYPNKTLAEIGIPFLHILKVATKDDIYFIELSGDENLLVFE